MTILIVSVSKVDNLDHFLETWFSLLETQTIWSHYTTLMSIAWWDENRRILQTPTNWVSKHKNQDLSFEKQAFLYSPLERILKGFLRHAKTVNGKVNSTCMYKCICKVHKKRTTERFFILKFGTLTQYFCMKSNFWTIKTVSILVKVCIYRYMLYTRRCQGYCL